MNKGIKLKDPKHFSDSYAVITAIGVDENGNQVIDMDNGKRVTMDFRDGPGKKVVDGIYEVNLEKLPNTPNQRGIK